MGFANLIDNTKKGKKKQSRKGKLSRQDIEQWAHNAVIFSAPALMVFLQQLADGQPLNVAARFLYVAGLNALIDLLRKFLAGK